MSSSRREKLKRLAWNPDTGKPDLEVMICPKRLEISGRNMAETYTAAYTLPETLRKPDAIFVGLRRDEDEPRGDSSVGWRCYAYRPARRYNNEGGTYPTPENRIFLAFVNDEQVVYRWAWEDADMNAGEYLPENYDTRFDERVY
jgi:hypothetical protein